MFLDKNKIKKLYSSKSQRITRILAVILIIVVVLAEFTKLGLSVEFTVELDADPTTADVGENILFNWTITGDFDAGWINFGDGNVTVFSVANNSITHKYALEGRYNVTLYAKTSGLTECTDSLMVEIKNNPPQFNISLTSQAYEDDAVSVSVVDIDESTHDSQDGILTYIYDFTDGNQTSSNSSSITHKWKNAGKYPVTITVIDDQGALEQKSQDIQINNKVPTANFTVHTSIPSEQLLYSYYGTFDFQQDILNAEPKNWTTTDTGDPEDVFTAILRPNGDVTTEWSPEGDHWDRINESYPDGVKINTDDDEESDEWEFTSFTLPNDYVVTSIKIKFYGKSSGIVMPIYGLVQYRIGTGSYSSSQATGFSTSYSWQTYTWSGLSLTQSDLDDLRVRCLSEKVPPQQGGDGTLYIDTAYIKVTYEPATTVSIVDLEGYYNEIVKLNDMATDLQASMEDSFTNQQYGTVEFWVGSNDAGVKTWAISFWDSSTMAFSITMDEDKWKYSTGGGYSDITECGTPLDNEWYWIRIDFCTSGTYLNLNADQFKINVNGTPSNVYSSASVDQIDKIKFESGSSDTGIAWIDAVGYSWDPNYDIGDNRIPCVYYPEKSNVHFYGNVSTDTASDLSSLRYYWQFGDSTSGFGKFVVHEFKQSGIYNVTLTVKDDNGKTDSYMQRVLIHNTYPQVDITTDTQININEGEAIIFYCNSSDEITDWAFLEYYWNFNSSEFSLFNLTSYENGGWRNTHIFTDDLSSSIGVLIRDPEGTYTSDAVNITISNVAPTISIWDANILANISFQVYRNSVDKDANFTFKLLSNNELQLEDELDFSGSSENSVFSEEFLKYMTLARNFDVVVNTSSELPQNSWFRCYVKLEFLNGDELIIASDKLYGGSYGYWNVSLNQYWYDAIDFTMKYPLTFNATIWDPSTDDVSYDLEYSVNMLLKITCADSLPISDSITITQPLGDADYIINIDQSGSDIIANITVTQDFSTQSFTDNEFPVKIDFTFTIYPIIDLFDLLEVRMGLTNLTIISCTEAVNFLEFVVSDDDDGSSEEMIVFITQQEIGIQNLMPQLIPIIPEQGAEAENITFYIQIVDFDLIYDQIGYNISYFKSDAVPTYQDDFTLINGSCDWDGELVYQNDNYATFTSEFHLDHVDLPTQPDNFTLYTGSSDWSGDLNLIDDDFTTFIGADLGLTQNSQNVRPNADVYTQWSGSTPHWSRLDETTPDGVKIYTSVAGKQDEWDFGTFTLPAGYVVTTLNVNAYGKQTGEIYATIKYRIGSGTYSSWKASDFSSSFSWKTYSWTDLSLTQDDLDDVRVRFLSELFPGGSGTIHVDTVYIEVVYEKQNGYRLNTTAEFSLGLTSDIFAKDLEYSYKTNNTQSIDLKIWNFQTSQWTTIDTSNYDSFSAHTFDLSSSYYDENYNVRLNFYGFNSDNPFNLELEMLKVNTGNSTLNFTVAIQMGDIQSVEELKYYKLLYSYKVDTSQQINLSIYNFQSETWMVINSSDIGTTFYRNRHVISNTEYYNSTYHVQLRFEAESTSNVINLLLDQLRLMYYYANATNQKDYFLEDIPEQSDFTTDKGTLSSTGDLSSQDNNYYTFISELIGDNYVDFTAKFHMTNSSKEDTLIYLNIMYAFKTNITTGVNVSLYNFLTQSWDIIKTLNLSTSWYIQNYSVIDSYYFNSTYDMLFRVEAVHSTDEFEFLLDQLKIQYMFSAYNATCDFGHNSLSENSNYIFEMSNRYSTIYFDILAFEAEGEYLISWDLEDLELTASIGEVINISNMVPCGIIGNFPNQTLENEIIHFTSYITIYGSNSTQNDYRFAWSFGDGLYAYTRDPTHAYSEAGVYNITLTVLDCYGNTYIDMRNITILERAPEILGPFTFNGIEGQAVELDVDIFDAFTDELGLSYEWSNGTGVFSTDKRPSIVLEEGSYDYTLSVTDIHSQVATVNISIVVVDSPPVVLVSNYMYSGGKVTESEGFFVGTPDGPGELKIYAYGYDMFDTDALDYNWTISTGNRSYTTSYPNGGTGCSVNFRVNSTATYQGEVLLASENKSAVACFLINSFIDSNGNGISDEFEARLLETNETLSSYSDTDDDGYTDLYETGVLNTNYTNPDTDGDGLWDGAHNVTGIGESTIGSDPLDSDTDDDGLNDNIEAVGWNITSEIYGEMVVTSNPRKIDTDKDGLSDYAEYNAGTDPRNPDTDNDDVGDSEDPFPTKADCDGDGLLDGIELKIGTDMNKSDTDGDGLSDGEEYYGWAFKTNPLTADSDHDFAADNAEMTHYKYSIDDRYDLDEPVTIEFEANCEKASSAQILFMITFGEAINEPENNKTYGVQNVPELNVTIYKVDDNLLLFNLTSSEFNQTSEDNTTRYLSRAVDIREIIENRNLDYRGRYMIKVNDTDAGCMLEQFDIEVSGYLDPNKHDFDKDGIMDGVEMGLLVRGTDTLDLEEIYGSDVTIQFPIEEIGWWMLDEGSGATTADSSYYDNDGELLNFEAGDWKTGKLGDYALEFDGVNEYIRCGKNQVLNFERNQSYSIVTWVKTSSANGSILSKMNVSNSYRGYDLFCKSDGVIRAHLINELNTNEIIVDGTTQIDDGEWHFVVLTYNGSSTAAGIKIYIDGTLESLTTVSDTLNRTIQT
ncbi:MAG: PKD domain-containing protein, partial [Promethearchaeota archaeon]